MGPGTRSRPTALARPGHFEIRWWLELQPAVCMGYERREQPADDGLPHCGQSWLRRWSRLAGQVPCPVRRCQVVNRAAPLKCPRCARGLDRECAVWPLIPKVPRRLRNRWREPWMFSSRLAQAGRRHSVPPGWQRSRQIGVRTIDVRNVSRRQSLLWTYWRVIRVPPKTNELGDPVVNPLLRR